MFLTALNFMANVTPVPPIPSRTHAVKPWWWNIFAHPAISPVLWIGSFFVGSVILLWSSFGLILPSISHGFAFLLLLFAMGLAQVVQSRVYVKVAPLYNGGWMPSLQRTWLSLGTIVFVLFSLYLFLWNIWLGVVCFLATLFYSWRYLGQQKERNLLRAFSSLVNAKERTEAPGIRWVERLCVVACLFWFLLSACALVEKGVPFRQPGYAIKILGKEVHRGGRGGTRYELSLSGWPSPGQRLDQRVSRSVYEPLTPGQTYRMLTWRGLLGTEYVKQFKLTQPAVK